MNFQDPRLPDRFWEKVAPCPVTGCWLWFAATNSDGYGHFSWNGRIRSANQVTFETVNGPTPKGLELDHRVCKQPACCNPSHLEAVTHRVNMLRGETNCIMRARSMKTCQLGHPFDRVRKDGARLCSVCLAARAKRRYIARHGDRASERASRDAQIVREYATGAWTLEKLGERYGIRRSQVSNIVRRAQ